MAQKSASIDKAIVIAFALSLLGHAAVVIVFAVRRFEAPAIPERPPVVEVEFVPAPPPEVPVAEPEPEPVVAKTEPPPPPPPVKPMIDQQVVEQLDKLNNLKDDNTKFLGAHDQKVEKQTKAKNVGKASNKKASAVATAPAATDGELPDLSAQFQVKKDESLGPLQSDYLKEIEEGKQTILSTRQFGYFAYYAGIKEAIRKQWEPTVKARLKIIYRQGRTIASMDDRVTQMLVVLNDRGDLLSVDILGSSGEPDLDHAAVEAFRQAAPFPNPPPGIVEPDGTIKIRWDFVLEI